MIKASPLAFMAEIVRFLQRGAAMCSGYHL
jgi:hypothetical protein